MPVDEARSAAIDLLRACGAEQIDHPGGDLFSHLVHTEEILRTWRAADSVCLAGLGHAFYGTAGFPTALLPLEARETLRAAIGAEAESLVYQYCSCDRQATYPAFGSDPIAFVDRFTGATNVVGAPELEPFAVITIANELDIVRARAFEARSVDGLRELCAALAPYVPTEARVAREETDRHE